MFFEWDEKKNKANLKKHKVSFDVASLIFADPNLLIRVDKAQHEDRWNAIGFVGTALFVVFTERENERVRLISARKATKEEVNEYYKNIFR